MNSILIDIVFVIFFLIMILYGYKKGFITRLYDVFTTILVLFLTYVLASPVSNIWQIYKYNTDDFISTVVGTTLNYFLVFVILFIGLFIIKKIIGIFVKPLLKGLMNKFSITSAADKILGVVISIIEAIVFTYIALVFIVIPFNASGATMIQETYLAKYVVNLVPNVAQDVIDMTGTLKNVKEGTSSYTLQSLTELLITAHDYHILSDEQIQTIVKENIAKELTKEKITLTKEKKQIISDMLSQSGYTKKQIESLIENINVSGE